MNDISVIGMDLSKQTFHVVALGYKRKVTTKCILKRRQVLSWFANPVMLVPTIGLLGEYGLIASKGVNALRKSLPDILEDAQNGLTDLFRQLLRQRLDQLIELETHILFYTDLLIQQASRCD